MPLTELWLSTVSERAAGREGVRLADQLQRRLALAVKTHRYSSGGAWKNSQTTRRARSTSSVDASEAGVLECGLPSTGAHQVGVRIDLLAACSPPPV